jgi:hypothetical protein
MAHLQATLTAPLLLLMVMAHRMELDMDLVMALLMEVVMALLMELVMALLMEEVMALLMEEVMALLMEVVLALLMKLVQAALMVHLPCHQALATASHQLPQVILMDHLRQLPLL